MTRGQARRVIVTRVEGPPEAAVQRRRPDELIVEEPMAIQLDGVRVATTMRTPGHDFELAVGFCFTDGLLAGHPVDGVRYCADGSAAATAFNVVTVSTGGAAPAPTARLGNVSSSCGWCGSEQLDWLASCRSPLPAGIAIDVAVVRSVPARVGAQQRLFARTGGAHAAAVFSAAGEIVAVREDVGRHNAVDKLVGAMVLGSEPGLAPPPAHGLGLFVSGRASIEMVDKAWAAGFATLVSVSAPTALAVDAARRAGMLLVGFARDGSCNVYSAASPRRSGPSLA